jgi:hypothetical protein
MLTVVDTREHRLEDRPHSRLAEPIHEAVEVRVLAADQQLFGCVDIGGADGLGRVGDQHLGELPRQGVDQPWLTLAELEGAGDRLGREHLAGLGGMLAVE